jgi:hypothetical protein
MNETNLSSSQLIAPCGINCGVCIAFQRNKNKCFGCWNDDSRKAKHCAVCKIKNCETLISSNSRFCYDCSMYPCKRMKQLDQRYHTKYNMSNLDNLMIIKDSGLDVFIQLENEKWKCDECGGMICVHRGFCLECEKKKIIKQ